MIFTTHLETALQSHPLSDAGLAHINALVKPVQWKDSGITNETNWAKATAKLWMGQPLKGRMLNMCGDALTPLLCDETDTSEARKFSVTTAAEIVKGMQNGIFDWRKLIPIWQVFVDALRNVGAPPFAHAYFDCAERNPSAKVIAAFPSMDPKSIQQMWLTAIYNTAKALAIYFRWNPDVVVCAGIANVDKPASYRVPCLTPHVWYGEVPLQPGAVVNISLETLNGAIKGLLDCYSAQFPVTAQLYHEAGEKPFDDTINDPRLATVLRAVGGSN